MKKICVILLCSFMSLAAASADESEKLQVLLDDIWQYTLSVEPLRASSLGEQGVNHKLPDISQKGLMAKSQQSARFLQQLSSLDKTQLLRSEQITMLMQSRALQENVDNFTYKSHYVPITSEYGFHSELGSLPNIVQFKSVKDYRDYLTRLRQFPQYFQQQIAWMKAGLKVGMTQPKVVMEGFEESVKHYFSGEITASDFYKPLLKRPQHLAENDFKALQKDARKIIKESVFPSYKAFYRFLLEEYIPQAKEDIAATSWPNGKALYQNRSDYYTTTDMSTDDIHQLGLSEVKRIRAEMQDIVDALDYQGSINDFIQYLRTDEKFYAKSASELIEYASYVSKKMDAKLPKLFRLLPRTPYGVAPVPESIAPKYTTGRYVSPSREDEPGYYWVNTYALDKRPLYAIPALTLHEAVPGHHLQISLAREMESLPPIRRYTYISAFGEGWGLYSEYLGKEVGMYEDPYDDFGRLSYEMWRACRLVVDTGMHTKGWSRQKALDYMLENTALSEHNVKTEIDRYISWPGQALSYKLGELTIKRLRQDAEQALQDKFDVRDFHHAILEYGSVPLSTLEENIKSYIEVNQ